MNIPTIGFAGLTHLGIISSVAAAARGCDVIGFHDDAKLISKLNSGTFPVQEPQLLDLFRDNKLNHNAYLNDNSNISER